MTDRVVLTGGPLQPDEVVAVAEGRATVEVGPEMAERMAPAKAVVDRSLAEGRVVYGVTTGFGALESTRVDPGQAAEMQVALLRSHAAGVGPPVSDQMVRAMLLLRARTLAQGHSGVRPEIVQRLVDFLRLDLLPVVPGQGSVGASGDLAQFAHLALPVIGEGELRDGGEAAPAAEVLAAHGMEPLVLQPKEGLSLLNGTEGMTAMGVIALDRSRRLVAAADIACALSVEALMGSARPFQARVHELRPHPGQAASAHRIASLIDGSEIGTSHADDFDHAVQDAYSLRCAPQVAGGARDTLAHAESVADTELASAVDNPVVTPDGRVESNGNFHGAPVAYVLDFLAIVAADLASISERRTDRFLDPARNHGLTAFLADDPGVDSGHMIAQYTQAAIVSELKRLAAPASVDSIPSSAMQEDHVSMGWSAGRKLRKAIDGLAQVLAIEILTAARAIDLRTPLQPAEGTRAVVDALRRHVPGPGPDRHLAPEIAACTDLVREGTLLEAAEAAVGSLA